MKNNRPKAIIEYVKAHPGASSSEIATSLGLDISPATLRRDLARLVAEDKLRSQGLNKGARYFLSPFYDLFEAVDVEAYYATPFDLREIREGYNFELIELLAHAPLFSPAEREKLAATQSRFRQNMAHLTSAQFKREMTRLAIDLSWKSSQIEGNTYSLLETERLLMERETASGRSLEEARMLLNHKEALDYIIENPHYLEPLSVAKIENIHGILIHDLDVDRNIRTRRVGITGTNYRPLDNEFQIREALEGMCELVNGRKDVFDKSLLLLMLLSYIQPFNDGNKRTARIVSNAALIAGDHCPISFRTVEAIDYKKAMLLFYERNNMSAIKQIFIDQFEFAVEHYF
jgi:fido (protein-threonine AMPylation protein)